MHQSQVMSFRSFALFGLVLVAASGVAPAGNAGSSLPNPEPTDNVNSRYTVEKVEVTGYKSRALSRSLRERLDSMIGQKLDAMALNRVAARIRNELRVDDVHIRIGKGTRPQQVAVQLEIQQAHKTVDFNLTRAGYISTGGWTGAAGVTLDFAGNRAGLAVMSDADTLLERATGFEGTFERARLLRDSNRLGFRLGYGALGENWTPQTAAAFASTPGAVRYGMRQYVEPELLLRVGRDLEFAVGISEEQLSHLDNGARPLSAAAVLSSVRYRSHFEGSEALNQDIEAMYSLRAATHSLGSDFVYSKHTANISYTARRGKQSLRVNWLAGLLNGTAPIYDRFSLGNSTTLRGWNKYAIAPLGAGRVVHGSTEYRYGIFEAFYDAGAIWDRAENRIARHSAGAGIRKDALQLAVAFPLRNNGRMDPVFLAGLNF